MTALQDKRKYRPSYKVSDDPPVMQITDRDRSIILAVYLRRFLNAWQVEAVFFPPKADGRRTRQSWALNRLNKLFHNQYLARPRLQFTEGEGRPVKIYAIQTEGIPVVASELGIDTSDIPRRPADDVMAVSNVLHVVGINNVWAMVASLARDGHFQLLDWVDDWRLESREYRDKLPVYTRGGVKTRKRPDGYFQIAHPSQAMPLHFFLEYDRGHMENARFAEKVKAYEDFRRSGASETHFGTRNFRVLTVTTSTARMENLRKATEEAGGGRHYWFTTEAEIDIWQPMNLLEPVWTVAGMPDRQALFG